MNTLWMTDIETVLEIYELAKKRGKKQGDNLQDIFEEYYKEHPEKFNHIGNTAMDKDLLCGNMRESGIKVCNPDEIDRRKKK
jgi:hypothetical protein